MFVAFFVVPVVIARAIRAPWREIGFAYAIVTIISIAFALWSDETTWEMRLTWSAIVFMILVIPGVPVILIVTRLLGRWGASSDRAPPAASTTVRSTAPTAPS